VDGVGSLAILDAITQPTRDEPARRLAPPPAEPPPPAAARLVTLARERAVASFALAGRAVAGALQSAGRPLATASEAARAVRGLGALVADALQPAARDPEAARSGGLSRRFDVLDLPIERLRKLRAPLDATINDVVLAALAGALARYQREQGQPVEPQKCMVPMNLRGRDEREAMGNRVGMFDVMLPLDEERPRARLERIRAQTRAAKRDQRGAAGPAFVEALLALPEAAFRRIARAAVGRVNVACTNVPGTAQRRYMSGARVEALYPFASVMQGTPIVMALLSYAGTLHVGIDTDPEVIHAPGRIPALFEACLAELEALA
jgi:WS/DGAT/MGAT family acyltransferase